MDFSAEVPELEMKLRSQVILVNLGIAAGLALEASRGASKVALLIVGVAMYLLANVIFWTRARKSR